MSKELPTLENVLAPRILSSSEFPVPFRLVEWDRERKSLTYQSGSSSGLMCVPIFLLEKHFQRDKYHRPSPKQKIITQGRWECGPATLAMLLNESLWNVKRAMVKVGWNNDDRGCTDTQLINAAALLGHEVYRTKDEGLFPQILSIPSLNVKNMSHVIYWNGTEMLDPNWGYKGRLFWGCEWGPEVLRQRPTVLVRADSGCSKFEPPSKPTSIKALKKSICEILNAPKEDDKVPA